MTKCIIILSILMGVSSIASAQTFAEWFKQKKTQKEYLIQQIAALQIYIGYVQKGYKIAQEGLTVISDFKNGEFNLHNDYFNSLKNTNPSVKNYAKVSGIIALQVETVKGCHKTFRQIMESEAFTPNEISYINQVWTRLLDDCADIIQYLITLTTSGELEMKDDERLKHIDRLYDAMQDDYIFMKHFGNQALMLAINRTKENNDIKANRALNGIKDK